MFCWCNLWLNNVINILLITHFNCHIHFSLSVVLLIIWDWPHPFMYLCNIFLNKYEFDYWILLCV
jgi:hypothetical protein